MKRNIIFCALLSASAAAIISSPAQAQAKKINIQEAAIEYDFNIGKFIVSGIHCFTAPETPDASDPTVKVILETGDGNYIEDEATFEELSRSDFLMPREGRFHYTRPQSTQIIASLIKTYDKGGPRTRQVSRTITPEYIPGYYNDLPYPAQAMSVALFDNHVVPGDRMPGVFTINNNVLFGSSCSFIINTDRLLSLLFRTPPGISGLGITYTTIETYPTHTRTQVRVSGIPEGAIINIFFDLQSDPLVAKLENGRKLIFNMEHSKTNPDLTIARSHDPNKLTMPLICNSLVTNEYKFIVDIENTGIAPEPDIYVGLKFSNLQFKRNTFRMVSSRFQGRDVFHTVSYKESDQQLSNRLGGSDILLSFRYELLAGTNRLPSGDKLTRGQVIFTIKLHQSLPTNTPITMQAFIYFGTAAELTPTRTLKFTLEDVKKACVFQNSCVGYDSCRFCGNLQLAQTWLCQ